MRAAVSPNWRWACTEYSSQLQHIGQHRYVSPYFAVRKHCSARFGGIRAGVVRIVDDG